MKRFDLPSPVQRHRVLLLVAAVLALGLAAGDPPAPMERFDAYYPRAAGAEWDYQVREEGKHFGQTVRLKARSGQHDAWIMTVESDDRRSEYHVHRDGDTLRLVRARGGVSLVPVWRTQRFEPPLPFLSLRARLPDTWSWSGRALGAGPRVVHATFRQAWETPGELLAVTSTLVTQEGDTTRAVSLYRRDVGLVEVTSPQHSKSLTEYRPASPRP